MDPYVLDVPWPIRKLIVSAFILPFRPKNSAEAYAKIWTEQGSPLLTLSQALADACGSQLAAPVALSMRYGKPDIQAGIDALIQAGVEHIQVVPLYPHFADSTVKTCVELAGQLMPAGVSHSVLSPFYDHPTYIQALARSVTDHLVQPWDHLLLSYHGLPERHLQRADPTGSHCLQGEDCCAKVPASQAHATCYRHHVMMTSTALAQALNLTADQYTVAFQSRLGRLPWLQPYTDQTLSELPKQGIKHLAVACPAFIVDNLETLEEIGLQGRQTFLQAGGETFQLVPCLNQRPDWVDALCQLLLDSSDQAVSANS